MRLSGLQNAQPEMESSPWLSLPEPEPNLLLHIYCSSPHPLTAKTFPFPALTPVSGGEVAFQVHYKIDIRIKESSTGLKPARLYPHLGIHLGCTNISIPADFKMLKPMYFSFPISILGKTLAKAINPLQQPVEVWVHPAPSPRSHLPSHSARLLVIHLDEFAKATGVVVMGCFRVSKRL